MTEKVRIAQLSCGPEYSGVQKEIDEAAAMVDAEIFFPDIMLADVRKGFDEFGLDVRSPDLKLAIARARALVDGRIDADAVFSAAISMRTPTFPSSPTPSPSARRPGRCSPGWRP